MWQRYAFASQINEGSAGRSTRVFAERHQHSEVHLLPSGFSRWRRTERGLSGECALSDRQRLSAPIMFAG
jgi:hypothetical protein